MTDTLQRFYPQSDIWSESLGNGFKIWTPFGTRKVDIAVRTEDGGLHFFEVKTGRSNYTRTERDKDQWLEEAYGFVTTVIRRDTECPICFPRSP